MKYLLLLLLSGICCLQQAGAQNSSQYYAEDPEDFANPERGFYIPLDTKASRFITLNADKMIKDRRDLQKHGSASYPVYSTLLYRGYVLDTFTGQPLSESFLQSLDNDFAMVRQAGVKMILRFAYTNNVHSGNCPDQEKICPPYGDAPKNIMLAHIGQLKPVLRKNADVIAVVQAGFIGIWGENYYTDHFGDASANGQGKILDENWRDRNELLKALLDAIPENRMVQVRTPQLKQKFVYGPAAATDVSPLKEEQAFSNADAARIGFHNDCFLAGIDDYGTFYDYGSSTMPKTAANSTMRKYFERDSRYGPVGGETCDDAFSPQNDCAPWGHAEAEMEAMHYSFLNTAYNNKVNNDWDSLGCIASIKKRLGYRFVLQDATFPKTVKAASLLDFSINLVNRGYASPFNPRPVILVLRNTQTGMEYFLKTKADPRFWFSGTIAWNERVRLPAELPEGSYSLYLFMPDGSEGLRKRPEYSIRLANQKLWETGTGYNKLDLVLAVTP